MVRRCRTLFDGELQQVGADGGRIEAQRTELARRCAQMEKERSGMKTGGFAVKFAVFAVIFILMQFVTVEALAAGTVVDITGQFSAEEACVFTREKDPHYGGWSDLVAGGSPDSLGWAEVIYLADGSFGGVSGVYEGRPAWLEHYYLTHGLESECDWISWNDSN